MKKIVILVIMLFCGTAHAQISRKTVNHAWQTLSRIEGITAAIHYESDSDPNAYVLWADDGTYTFHVTTGLLRVLQDESEIAGVLGHEIGHVKLGHYNNIILTDTARTILTANMENTDSLAQAVGKIDVDLRESLFSREQETDADNYGVSLLRRSGYDVWGLYNAMKRLGVQEHSGFSSHPATRERLANLEQQARAESHEESHIENEGTNDVDDIAAAIMGR